LCIKANVKFTKLAFFPRIKRRPEKKGKISECMKEVLEAMKITEKTFFRR
jgi:hypothetical protein